MESRQFYKNDVNSLKLILEAHVEPQRGITESGFVVAKQSKPEGAVAEQSASDAHAEARKMKEQYGNFKTACLCVNQDSTWQAKRVELLAEPMGPWRRTSHHSDRPRCQPAV